MPGMTDLSITILIAALGMCATVLLLLIADWTIGRQKKWAKWTKSIIVVQPPKMGKLVRVVFPGDADYWPMRWRMTSRSELRLAILQTAAVLSSAWIFITHRSTQYFDLASFFQTVGFAVISIFAIRLGLAIYGRR
jgi:hypothetical protein